MSGDLVVGIDCSTTAVKAIAFDLRGDSAAEGRAPLTISNPAPDAWEQDPAAWWTASCEALAQVTSALGPSGAGRIRAMCVAHQRETFALTGPDGEPLCPAVLWMDGRGGPQVDDLVGRLGRQWLTEVTGKPPCVTPSMYKIARLFEVHPGLRAASPHILDVGAYVVWRLTGERRTSTASADPMGIVDMRTADYADDILEALGVRRAQLPGLVPPGTQIGSLLPDVARQLGLAPGLAVIAGAGDGQAAGIGAGIAGRGRAYLNLGTAIVSGVLSDRYAWGTGFRTLFGGRPGSFFLETDLKGGTFTFNWLVERILGATESERPERLAALATEAATLPPGADGLLLLPYFCGVMNPYWDDSASGVLFGLRGEHGPAHIYRAIAEGIALEQRIHLEHVEAAVGAVSELVVVGGPAQSDFFCQIIADVVHKRIVKASTPEATALGAAVLAAAAVGLFATLDQAAQAMTRTGGQIVPGRNRPAYDSLFREVYRGLFEDVRDRMARLDRWRRGDHLHAAAGRMFGEAD